MAPMTTLGLAALRTNQSSNPCAQPMNSLLCLYGTMDAARWCTLAGNLAPYPTR
uniref:Uncharacterized protein n=1 Tax=Arundo donax TaxID=35708 RepID=A0A0A9DBU5_ARUDO